MKKAITSKKTPVGITIKQVVRFGKPCIKGTRITISDILHMLQIGYSIDDIPKQYTSLKKKDIKVALSYTAKLLGNEEVYEIS